MVRSSFRLAALLGCCALLSAPAFALDPFAIDTTLDVVSPSALTFNVGISASGDSDSDSDSSSLSGTADVLFSADFEGGNLRITDFEFTGGEIVVDQALNLDFSLGFGLVTIDADGTGFQGVPSTDNPPTTLSIPATPGTLGQFPASDGIITINQGNIHVVVSPLIGSDTIIDLDLSDPGNQIEGTSTSSAPGTVTVTQGAIDTLANTTQYSLTVNLPVEFDSPAIDLDGQGTATVSVSGQFQSVVTDITVDFIPWNGLVGDVNQNGSVGQDDIDAFIDGWRSSNDTPGKLAYMLGDMNFDGITNLHDAFILHEALKGQNLSFQVGGVNIPEPSTMLLGVLGCAALMAVRRR